MTDYGSLIKEAREKAGLTQEQLGSAIGVTGVTIMRYEKGQRTPSSKVVGKIASVLGADFAISVIEEVGHSVTKALDKKERADKELNARHDQIVKAWRAAEEKEGRQLSFDEAMAHYKVDIATQQRIDAAIHKLNMEGRRIAAERLEELTEIPKYTMPIIPKTIITEPSEGLEDEDGATNPTEQKKPPESEKTPNDGK